MNLHIVRAVPPIEKMFLLDNERLFQIPHSILYAVDSFPSLPSFSPPSFFHPHKFIIHNSDCGAGRDELILVWSRRDAAKL